MFAAPWFKGQPLKEMSVEDSVFLPMRDHERKTGMLLLQNLLGFLSCNLRMLVLRRMLLDETHDIFNALRSAGIQITSKTIWLNWNLVMLQPESHRRNEQKF